MGGLRAAVALTLFLTSCGGESGGGPENLLLITFDTTRADHLGCTGRAQAHTPTLDGLARRGVLFDTCITPAPITLPSHASLLSGLEPYHHGARNNGTHNLPTEVTTLAESLSRAGFETGAVVSSVVLDSRHGLDQGFDHYDDELSAAEGKELFSFRETPAEDTARRALQWLDKRGEKRWFLWVHFFDPHADYDPPAEYLELTQGSRYDGEIAYADAQLGKLLDHLQARAALEKTLVVMTADHGESLGEHGENTHGLFIYDATTRVPLIVSHASLVAGKRVSQVVRTIDVAPTVLELLNVGGTGKLDGTSLASVVREPQALPPAIRAYSEAMLPLYNHGWSDLRALRDLESHYLRAPRAELYDLRQDPGELVNLLPTAAERAQAYAEALAARLPAKEADSQAADLADLDPELQAELQALGYGWSASGVDLASDEPRRDPKDMIEVWTRTLLGRSLVRNGALEEGIDVLREVLAADPSSVNAHEGLTTAYRELGRVDEALEQVVALTALPGVSASAWSMRASLERQLGKGDWRASLARAQVQSPHDPQVWATLGEFELEDGRREEAMVAFKKGLEIDEQHGASWLGVANVEQKLGRAEAAEEALLKAVEFNPLSPSACYSLGVLRDSQGKYDEALKQYERTLELDPDNLLAWLKIGNLRGSRGDLERAREAYEAALALEADNFNAHYNLGALFLREERSREGLEHFRKATEINPDSADAWHKRMIVARGAGEVEEALTSARRLLELEPDHVQAMIVSVLCLDSQGEREGALESLRRALAADRERVLKRAESEPGLRALLGQLDH
jgi:arylsulfatase A-like enzyme/Tfp pilus assembly protein PilF